MSNLPMAIEYLPDLLVLKNEHYDLVHSLPYIEAKLTNKKEIDDIVKQEMAAMRAENGNKIKDYLSPLPMPSTSFIDSPKMKAEYERIMAEKESGVSDISMTEVDSSFTPLEKSKIELEYASIQRLNLELMQEYNNDEFTQTQNEDLIHHLKYQLNKIDQEITEVNKKRKFNQNFVSEEI